jgi:hypothetical protein
MGTVAATTDNDNDKSNGILRAFVKEKMSMCALKVMQ